MQSSTFHRTGVGLFMLVAPVLSASLVGCGVVDPELGLTLGACDIINCDTMFFLGLNDDHDEMDDDHDEMTGDHDDMSMEEDHDAMNDDHDDM